jgi:hypothetical protein
MAGETQWHRSVTQNISCGGAAIHTDDSVLPGTPVTLMISLPSAGSETGGYLIGLGQVVRTIDASESTYAGFAVAVKRYRLDRRTDLPSRLNPSFVLPRLVTSV